jgi:hypothetical protein
MKCLNSENMSATNQGAYNIFLERRDPTASKKCSGRKCIPAGEKKQKPRCLKQLELLREMF